MAWEVIAEFSYKEVLASVKMNQIRTNFDLLIRTELGGQTITPASAVSGLHIDQNYDAVGIKVDSDSATYAAIEGWHSSGVGLYGDGNIGIHGKGTTFDLSGEAGFSVKNAYVSTGNEALRWDVVEFNLIADGAGAMSVGYSLDTLKCVGLLSIGNEVGTYLWEGTDESVSKFNVAYYTDADDKIHIKYGSAYLTDDDMRIIVFTKA